MKIGGFFLLLAVVAFLVLPVMGYQYYLKGLRGQTDALRGGTEEISSSYKTDLKQLQKLKQMQSGGAVAAEDAGKQADAMMKKLMEAQKKK